MLLPELKLRRDKIRSLMAQQEIDAALIACNVNLIYTYGRVVSITVWLRVSLKRRCFLVVRHLSGRPEVSRLK